MQWCRSILWRSVILWGGHHGWRSRSRVAGNRRLDSGRRSMGGRAAGAQDKAERYAADGLVEKKRSNGTAVVY